MTIPLSSDLAHYRVTFFFGPETTEHRPDHVRCVFNVKNAAGKAACKSQWT